MPLTNDRTKLVQPRTCLNNSTPASAAGIRQIEQPDGRTAEARKQVAWRRFWTQLAERVGSPTRAYAAKAVLLSIQDEFGDRGTICWPSTIIEGSDELTRAEVFRAIDDLVDLGIIDLDATDAGIYIDHVLRTSEEIEFLENWNASVVSQ